MASGAVEKTADELRKEIQELQRQQREVYFSLFFFSLSLSFLRELCFLILRRSPSGYEIREDSAAPALLPMARAPPEDLASVVLLDPYDLYPCPPISLLSDLY